MNTRWPWIVFAAIILLIGGGALYLKLSGTPLEEMVELIAVSGEKQLRDPMRPARGSPRVLLFALDGVGEDELRAAIHGGGAPHIAALLGAETGGDGVYEHAYAVPGVLSILPSTTYAAWASVFTGQPAGQTGVPGNEWFVREEMQFYAPAPVSVSGSEHALEVYTENLIGQVLRVPTLYEQVQLRSYVSLASVYRGADLLTTPDLAALDDLVAVAAEGLTTEDEFTQEAYEELDRTSVESLIESLDDHGLADLQTIYFPGVDLYTHVAEPALPEQRDYLRDVTDPLIGKVLDEYRARGALDSTYVVFVADHGHTPVLNDDRHNLGAGGDDEPPALIEAVGFRMRPFVLEAEDDEQDYQAAVAYQGAIAYVYLADRSTCPEPGDICDWTRPPRFGEDVLPVTRAFHENNLTGTPVAELRGALDLIFAREPRPPGADALPFQVWDGERLVPVGDYLAENPRPDLLDLEERLEGLATGPYGHRAGDVLLLAKSGIERPVEERFYFSERYHSWHGSPTAQDSRIPLIVAHPGKRGAELRAEVREAVGENPSQLDITPLVGALLEEW